MRPICEIKLLFLLDAGVATSIPRRFPGLELVTLQGGSRSRALAIAKEPVQIARHVRIASFTPDATRHLAIAIEDDGCGNDVAEFESVKGADVGAGPDIEGDVLLLDERLDFGEVFRVVDGDGDKAHALSGILLAEE